MGFQANEDLDSEVSSVPANIEQPEGILAIEYSNIMIFSNRRAVKCVHVHVFRRNNTKLTHYLTFLDCHVTARQPFENCRELQRIHPFRCCKQAQLPPESSKARRFSFRLSSARQNSKCLHGLSNRHF